MLLFVQAYGVELGAKMCKYLLANGTPGLHMYSLNMEKSALAILERVGFINNAKVGWGFKDRGGCWDGGWLQASQARRPSPTSKVLPAEACPGCSVV